MQSSQLTCILEDGVTLLDEAPETPAPLFAIRAFKTAIFGTPHTTTSNDLEVDKHRAAWEGSRGKENGDLEIGAHHDQQPESETCTKTKALSLGACVSPAKGILLTPGTATSRRKTVSFWGTKEHAIFNGKITTSEEDPVSPVPQSKGSEQSGSLSQGPRHSKLTKTLIEMSAKQGKPQSNEAPQGLEQTVEGGNASTAVSVAMQKQHQNFSSDQTIDLSKPRSRSGQHWKSEYEEYYKRSSREMKKVIQYGQNIKTYALQKDHEASLLGEELKKELAKVEQMETRISWLAKQLNAARSHIPSDESTQTRLIGEVAQQTALANQYRRKAEQYRKAMKRRSLIATTDAVNEASLMTDFEIKRHRNEADEAEDPNAQLERLEENAREAQNRAASLEAENLELKRHLARVKEEMMSYESRRKSREERLKAREHDIRAAKEQCERELEQVRLENNRLLRAAESGPDGKKESFRVIEELPFGHAHTEMASNQDGLKMGINSGGSISKAQQRSRLSSPRKRKQNTLSKVDIWTHGSSPSDQATKQTDETPKDDSAVGISSVKRDIHRTLSEIDQNLLSKDHRQPVASKDGVFHEVKTPRSDMLLQDNKPDQLVADDVDVGTTTPIAHDRPISLSHQQSSPPRVHALRSASLPSTHTPYDGGNSSRAGTMGSARTSSLSAERTAAAKARLERRSKVRRRGLGELGPDQARLTDGI